MIKSLHNSAAGINAQQSRIDTTSNNIVGINVDSYKAQRLSFADMVYAKMADAGRPVVAPPGERPLHGAGVRQIANLRDFIQGSIRETGRKTDLAIDGRGFFKVILPDGSEVYTRNGNFNLNANRELVNDDGYKLFPGITLPAGSQGLSVDKYGNLSVTEGDGQNSEVGSIPIYNFVNPNGLKALGKNLFSVSEEAGPEEEGTPGQEGFGAVIQGALESSNVDLAVEMTNLLEAQRIYQLNARSLKTSDDMWGMANNLRK
ncbi:MAG: flagellar basal-body rod protein FlgG [Desulfocucumaceae bacterium]